MISLSLILLFQSSAFSDLGNIMLEHILDTILESDRARGASSTRTLHLDNNDTRLLFKVNVLDVATILLYERPHTRLDNLFDKLHGLAVVVVDCQVVILRLLGENGLASRVVFRDDRQDFRLDALPLQVINLRH